jgi:3-oxoacyl-[acyl-carrier-protein] synthase II
MELAASMIGLAEGEVPFTLNYERPDPQCPVNVIRGEPLRTDRRTFVKLSNSRLGPAAALIIAEE